MKKTTIETLNKNNIKTLKDLRIALEELREDVVKAVENEVNTKKYHIEFRDTTSCVAFMLDENNKTLYNIYDNFRLQFTTQQAKKYRDLLLVDDRFYTFTYKQKEFISAKSKDIDDFFNLVAFASSVCVVYADSVKAEAKTKAVKAESKQKTKADKKQASKAE